MTYKTDVTTRILLIEDEPIIARTCARILSSQSYAVDIAQNGLMAKEMLQETNYNICVSDIRTPEMNGMEFYRYLKEEHSSLAKRLLFITGDVLNEDVKRFLTENPVSYLLKPFSVDELIGAVNELTTSNF